MKKFSTIILGIGVAFTAIASPINIGEEAISMVPTDSLQAQTVEVRGQRRRSPEKMDFLTRMPLRSDEHIQSIAVISDKVIEKQGALTLSDVTRNAVGVSTFATYGGASESLTTRGFRGIPILKNGVRVQSDFRGQGTLMDMQGVESVQVAKGAMAITQGVGNDIGSAGGTVNVATKTPHFTNGGNASLRVGSWGLVRPTFDVQGVFNDNIGLRLNGAYERSDSYRKYVSKDRFYFNPSFGWRIGDRTTLTLEMDYLHDSRTPDRGTVNLAADSVNALYDMPHNKFLGFKTDRIFTNQMSYGARLNHWVTSDLALRVAVSGSSLSVDNTGASTALLHKGRDYNELVRSLGRSKRSDDNMVVQVDLVGRDLHTGSIKHTFQAGVDFRTSTVGTTSFGSVKVDTINVLDDFSNTLPSNIKLKESGYTQSKSYSYGIMAQNVTTFNKYLKAVIGLRYSFGNSTDNTASGATSGDALDPMLGLIVTPFKGFNIFGSYTTTTDLRSAANLTPDGSTIGKSTTYQFETGVKTDWLKHRLHVNLTLFSTLNKNLTYQVLNDAGQGTGRYERAGDLRRKGLEVEVTGRPMKGLEVILGYAYLDAKYVDSPAYVDGSAPLNAPKHTANAWVYYTTNFGLNLGLGAYYVGARPVNDYTKKTTHTNTQAGVKPFDMNPYTTINATISYTYKNLTANLVFNNIFNAKGYSSYYRGGYINPIDPFNASATLTYRF